MSGKWEMETRFDVKLTRAWAMPACVNKPRSIFEMQPAHRMAGTAKSERDKATAAVKELPAFTAPVPQA